MSTIKLAGVLFDTKKIDQTKIVVDFKPPHDDCDIKASLDSFDSNNRENSKFTVSNDSGYAFGGLDLTEANSQIDAWIVEAQNDGAVQEKFVDRRVDSGGSK